MEYVKYDYTMMCISIFIIIIIIIFALDFIVWIAKMKFKIKELQFEISTKEDIYKNQISMLKNQIELIEVMYKYKKLCEAHQNIDYSEFVIEEVNGDAE